MEEEIIGSEVEVEWTLKELKDNIINSNVLHLKMSDIVKIVQCEDEQEIKKLLKELMNNGK